MKTNSLGLPVKETKVLVAELNILLANFQVYYQNLRGLHWNIRGKRFFDLHVKFEELYNDAQLKVDLIAERVLTLGGVPLHSFDDYIKNCKDNNYKFCVTKVTPKALENERNLNVFQFYSFDIFRY